MAKAKKEEGLETGKSKFELLMKKMNEDFGKGTIISGNSTEHVEAVSSGSFSFDIESKIGGLPIGRIIEISGPESCLDGETFISYDVYSSEGDRINHKGGTIKRLYERFHNTDVGGSKQGRKLQNNNGIFYVKSVNHENSIIRNQVLDVVKTGRKECYTITTQDNQRITCTREHKFLTPDGFYPLSDLKIDSDIFIHSNTRSRGRLKYETRPTVMVKYHPKLPTKIIEDKYVYYRGQISRLAYEAYANNFTYSDYINFLNKASKEEIDNLWFIPDNIHVHHKDENFNNNKINNLALISPQEHGLLHAKDRMKNLSFIATVSKISSIEFVGYRETYDIKCAYPYNNYIANDIVVHNSGKSTFALHAIAEFQKKFSDKKCALIDAETSYDLDYAARLGVDVENLVIVQPDTMEDAYNIIIEFIESGLFSLLVFDSHTASAPKAIMEGDVGDATMALQARLNSMALMKINPLLFKNGCTLVAVSQLRSNIGGYGNPNITTGGNAYKFYSAMRLLFSRQTDKPNELSKTKVEIFKSKVGRPFGKAEFDIVWGEGIDKMGELIDYGVELELIKQGGAWFEVGEAKLQGRESVKEFLRDNPEFTADLEKRILSKIKEN